MDERSSELEKNEMRETVLNARKQVVEEIAAKDDFTPEEALRLGGTYVACAADLSLFAVDRFEEIRDAFTSGRMDEESALFKAQSGDYTGIKEILEREGKGYLDRAKSVTLPNTEREQKLGEKFHQMLVVLPDHGKPYLPPPPPAVKR